MAYAELITIGNELLNGRTLNSNATWLGKTLGAAGIVVQASYTVPDRLDRIVDSIVSALKTADVLILSGGLGPTRDDVTKKAFVQLFGGELVMHEPARAKIEAFFRMRGREPSPNAYLNALVPSTAQVLDNPVGAAPGLVFTTPEGKMVFATPGVPYEMQALTEQYIIPAVQAAFTLRHVRQRVFLTAGVPESNLTKRLNDLEDSLPPQMDLAYNPNYNQVKLRLSLDCLPSEAAQLDPVFDQACAQLQQQVGDSIFGEGEDDSLPAALARMLRARGLKLAVAESCTGGGLMARLVSVPGVSDVLLGGIVAYDNAVKMKQLGVPQALLDAHGAVSAEVACAMAEGVRQKLGTDIALAITGIAGPTGGSDDKPVGTVYYALAMPGQPAVAERQLFERDRSRNLERAIITGLILLRKSLLAFKP